MTTPFERYLELPTDLDFWARRMLFAGWKIGEDGRDPWSSFETAQQDVWRRAATLLLEVMMVSGEAIQSLLPKSDVEAPEKTIARLQYELNFLHTANQSLREAIDTAMENERETAAASVLLETKVRSLDESLNAMTELRNVNEAAVAGLRADRVALLNTIEGMLKDADTAKAEIADLRHQLAAAIEAAGAVPPAKQKAPGARIAPTKRAPKADAPTTAARKAKMPAVPASRSKKPAKRRK